MIRRGGAALAVLTIILLAWASTSTAAPRTVSPGATFTVTAGGFAPGAAVTEQLQGHPGPVARRADGSGRVRFQYRAPRVAGSYRLLLVGRVRLARPAPAVPSGAGDVQVITVEVPRVVTIAFVVLGAGPSHSVGGTSAHTSPSLGISGVATSRGGGGGSGSAGGGTANTGTDVLGLLAVAALATVSGIAVSVVGRRRRAH